MRIVGRRLGSLFGWARRLGCRCRTSVPLFTLLVSLNFENGREDVPYADNPITTREKMPWAMRIGRSNPKVILSDF